jgi:hypothetical protein
LNAEEIPIIEKKRRGIQRNKVENILKKNEKS